MRQRRALAAAVALALWLAGGQFSGGRAANAVGCAPAPRSHFQTPQQSPQRRAVDDESPACSDCRQLTINARQISLQAIQDDMLSKLGFARPPNITGRAFPNIPDNLRQQYDRALQSPYASAESDMQADQPVHLRHRGDDEDSPTAERIVAFPQPHHTRHTWKNNRVMYYRFADNVMQSRLLEAFLHVYLVDSGSRQEGNRTIVEDDDDISSVSVQVTRVWRGPSSGWNAVLAGNVGVGLTRAQLRKGHRVRVDVTNEIDEWMSLPRIGLGLVVKVVFDNKRRRYHVPMAGVEDIDLMPYLELYVDDEPRRRTKRNVGLQCTENSKETRCCRYPLTVDFVEFGWDWIIAPKRYEANFCMGDCLFAFMHKYPNTHVVHLAAPPQYKGPCCNPRKVGPISLLYFNHHMNIVFRSIPGMVVEKCGCA